MRVQTHEKNPSCVRQTPPKHFSGQKNNPQAGMNETAKQKRLSASMVRGHACCVFRKESVHDSDHDDYGSTQAFKHAANSLLGEEQTTLQLQFLLFFFILQKHLHLAFCLNKLRNGSKVPQWPFITWDRFHQNLFLPQMDWSKLHLPYEVCDQFLSMGRSNADCPNPAKWIHMFRGTDLFTENLKLPMIRGIL